MEEDNNNNNNNNNNKKNYPSIPSNYVTLLQLQEKWLKEKEKEKQKQQQRQELKAKEQPIKSRRNNRKAVEKAVVATHESAEKEVNNEELSSSSSSSKKKKKRKNWRNKKKEETQSRANEEKEEEEEVKGGDVHAPPVSNEKENVSSVRRVWLKKGMRSEFRPKTDNVVLVQSEGLEKDRKFRDLSMKQNSEGLEGGTVVVIDRKFRDISMNNRSEEVKNYISNRGVRRGDRGYNGNGGGGGYTRFGGYQGEQRRTRSGPGLGVVWVKKGEIVDGNQSSSSSVKELE